MTEATKRIWHDELTLDYIRERMADTLAAHLGIQITEIGADYMTGTMPVDNRTRQPMGILHGGASVVLAESLGSWAANAVVDTTRYACVGQEINANHIRPVPQGGIVTGIARPLHLGGRSQVWSIEIFNERKQLACVSRLTMAVINR
jgi:1,4-dihydroxy-2-naphthoyl-CoA hydrolase